MQRVPEIKRAQFRVGVLLVYEALRSQCIRPYIPPKKRETRKDIEHPKIHMATVISAEGTYILNLYEGSVFMRTVLTASRRAPELVV